MRVNPVGTILGAAFAIVALALVGWVTLRRDDEGGLVPDPAERAVAPRPAPAAPAPPVARCPAGLAGCREVSGRIVYVERVDPDGDGDAHFVLADTDSVTGPGITVVDVRAELRPNPLPGVGDRLSAAGSVATGSYGQRQIEAVNVRAAGS